VRSSRPFGLGVAFTVGGLVVCAGGGVFEAVGVSGRVSVGVVRTTLLVFVPVFVLVWVTSAFAFELLLLSTTTLSVGDGDAVAAGVGVDLTCDGS